MVAIGILKLITVVGALALLVYAFDRVMVGTAAILGYLWGRVRR